MASRGMDSATRHGSTYLERKSCYCEQDAQDTIRGYLPVGAVDQELRILNILAGPPTVQASGCAKESNQHE